MLDIEQQKILLEIARKSVEFFVLDGTIKDFSIDDRDLCARSGAFVTIRNKENELRGCIGIIENNEQPLYEEIRDMAIAAASEDNRFLPVTTSELKDLIFEISVLSNPEIVDDWKNIELGKHGVIVQKGLMGGVFLPQVATETGWSLEEFLGELCSQKAGLATDSYKSDKDLVLKTFTAFVFSE